jgi:pentatricopeptide repeat protein
MEDAQKVINKMPSWTVVSWTALITRHVKCGQGHKALELFEKMQQESVQPDPVTFIGLLNACASQLPLEEGRRIHQQIVQSGCESNIFVGNSLVDMYAKCRSMEEAWRLFNKMPLHNVVSCTALICGQDQEALVLCQQMQQEGGWPSHITFIGVLNACASVAALDKGKRAHQQIIESGFELNVFVWEYPH